MTTNSIFDLLDEASPLGNWLPKRVFITYRSYSSNNDVYSVLFNVRMENAVNVQVTVSLEESNILINELIASKTILVKDGMTYSCNITFPKTALSKLTQSLLEGEFEFVGRATCEGAADALTAEFKIMDQQIEKQVVPQQKSKPNCFCNRDITPDELKTIVISLRKGELTGEKRVIRDKKNKKNSELGEPILDAKGRKQYENISQYDYDYMGEKIFEQGHERINRKELSYQNFAKYLNDAFRDYEVTTCIRKIHFLAQSYHETQRFLTAYQERAGSNTVGGEFYRGRGLLQITHKDNYSRYYTSLYHKEPSDDQLHTFVPTLAESFKVVCSSGGWYWKDQKLNKYADADQVDNVSAAINYPIAVNGQENQFRLINGRSSRTLYCNLLKRIFNYDECKNNKSGSK